MTGKYSDTVPDMYNGLKLTGSFDLIAQFPNGRVEHRFGKNLVTSVGESLVAKLIDINGAETAPNYIAFGSGSNNALKSDTQLQSEIASTRELVDSTLQVANTLALTWNITVGSTYTIREMGIFNDAAAGTIFSRFLTQQLTVASGVVFDIVWTLTISGVD